MNDISQETLISSIRNSLDYLGKQYESEDEIIADYRMWYDDLYPLNDAIKVIDAEIIRRAKELGKYIYDQGNYDDEMKSFWAWNPEKIAKGEFPLEKIPDHVRDLAKELYYD